MSERNLEAAEVGSVVYTTRQIFGVVTRTTKTRITVQEWDHDGNPKWTTQYNRHSGRLVGSDQWHLELAELVDGPRLAAMTDSYARSRLDGIGVADHRKHLKQRLRVFIEDADVATLEQMDWYTWHPQEDA